MARTKRTGKDGLTALELPVPAREDLPEAVQR